MSGALAAAVQELEDPPDQARGLGLVREHVDIALRGEALDEDRLLGAVLADAARAVARAQAGLLPATHGQLERGVVEHRVVDADRPGLDPARDRLPLGS